MVSRSRKVICLSEDMRDTLVSKLGHAEKYVVQTQCVQKEETQYLDIRQHLGLAEDCKLVLLTGGARAVKD